MVTETLVTGAEYLTEGKDLEIERFSSKCLPFALFIVFYFHCNLLEPEINSPLSAKISHEMVTLTSGNLHVQDTWRKRII